MTDKSDKTKTDRVKTLYVDKDTLSIRIGLHNKYSVNKYGFGNWIFDQIELKSGCKVLELGCGTGNLWLGKAERIPSDAAITLTDFSPLMVQKCTEQFKANPVFTFMQADIQDLPFEDSIFDIVIANHMLYHVPDIDKGLGEVRRVLKPGGLFYAYTTATNTMWELHDVYRAFTGRIQFSFADLLTFTLDNGTEMLSKYFEGIEIRRYEDALEITEVDDLMDYIASYNSIPTEHRDDLRSALVDLRSPNGTIHISKEQGMFICK